MAQRGVFGPHFHVSVDGKEWDSAGNYPELIQSGAKPTVIAKPADNEADQMVWHFSHGGQRRGPVSLNQLRKLAGAGQLGPEDLVWKEDLLNWAKVVDVGGILPAGFAARTSVEAIASLLFAIAGASVAPLLGSLIGVIFGHVALSRIRKSNGRLTGKGLAYCGLVLGYFVLAIGIVGGMIFLTYFVRQSEASV